MNWKPTPPQKKKLTCIIVYIYNIYIYTWTSPPLKRKITFSKPIFLWGSKRLVFGECVYNAVASTKKFHRVLPWAQLGSRSSRLSPLFLSRRKCYVGSFLRIFPSAAPRSRLWWSGAIGQDHWSEWVLRCFWWLALAHTLRMSSCFALSVIYICMLTLGTKWPVQNSLRKPGSLISTPQLLKFVRIPNMPTFSHTIFFK